jgi:hypothetical protein
MWHTHAHVQLPHHPLSQEKLKKKKKKKSFSESSYAPTPWIELL